MTEGQRAKGQGQRLLLSPTAKDGRPVLDFASQEDWERWLAEEHATSDGVWLKFAKKGAGISSVNYAQALETALCYGWIDSQAGGLDEAFYMQRFTPRGPRSKWSRINTARAEALINQGKMQPAGLRQVEAAKADGRWDAAYAGPREVTVPPDLQAELDSNPPAKDFFTKLSSQNRYAILYRIQDAKRPETRTARIRKFVDMLIEGKTVHPQ
jgi:uncharacterized protein YdeI (YjbR/CyaY-like superfamily)